MSAVRKTKLSAGFQRDGGAVVFDVLGENVHKLNFVSKCNNNVEPRRMECNCRGIFVSTRTYMCDFESFCVVVPNVYAAATHCYNQLLSQTDIHTSDGSRMEHRVQVLHLGHFQAPFLSVVWKLGCLQLIIAVYGKQSVFRLAQANWCNAVTRVLRNHAYFVNPNFWLQ